MKKVTRFRSGFPFRLYMGRRHNSCSEKNLPKIPSNNLEVTIKKINTMGNWQLEVAKMVLYMSFPVGMFHYFNQPEVYESWIVQKKREIYPMVNREEEAKIRAAIQNIRERREAKALNEMENSLNK